MTETVDQLPVYAALVERVAALDEAAASARHAELSEILHRANRLYYQEDAPELSDAEYDRLMAEIVTEGRGVTMDATPLDLARFARGAAHVEPLTFV